MRTFVLDYLRQVRESKALVYAMCDRLGLRLLEKRSPNFVLSAHGRRSSRDRRRHCGAPHLPALTARNEPGCEGCIRITAGIVEHTRRGLAVLEEVLCGAR